MNDIKSNCELCHFVNDAPAIAHLQINVFDANQFFEQDVARPAVSGQAHHHKFHVEITDGLV